MSVLREPALAKLVEWLKTWSAEDQAFIAAALDRAAQVREFTNTREPHRQTVPAEAVPGDGVRSPEPECHGLDTPERVCFYEQDFYVLSNFSAFSVEWRGITFATAEAAYHWERFRSEDGQSIRNMIYNAKSAHEAFKIAQANKIDQCTDWDAIKVDVMRDILRAKVNQHEYVRRKLLATGDRELVENSWRDYFWGWGPNRDGKNMLGKLWMEVRKELRDGAAPSASQEPAQAGGDNVASATGIVSPANDKAANDGDNTTSVGARRDANDCGANARLGSVIGVACPSPERAPEQEDGLVVWLAGINATETGPHPTERYQVWLPFGPIRNDLPKTAVNPGFYLVKLKDDGVQGEWAKATSDLERDGRIISAGDRLCAALSVAQQELSATQGEKETLTNMLLDVQSCAFGWMKNHDQLMAFLRRDENIEAFRRLVANDPRDPPPSPVKAPELLARAQQSEAEAARMRPVVEALTVLLRQFDDNGDLIDTMSDERALAVQCGREAVDALTAATKGGEK